MKSLVKIIFSFFVFYFILFLFMKAFNILDFTSIEEYLNGLTRSSSTKIFISIILLLTVDLLLSIPTIPVCLLAGFLLGAKLGFLAIIIGLYISGISGYLLGKYKVSSLIKLIVKDESKRLEIADDFQLMGGTLIILSRSIPMLPEVTSILAGSSHYSFKKFLILLSLNIFPYALVLANLGAQSHDYKVQGVLLLLFVIYLLLWSLGYILIKKRRKYADTQSY